MMEDSPAYINNRLSLSLKSEITKDQLENIKQLLQGKVGKGELEKAEDFCYVFNLLFDRRDIDIGEYGFLKKLVEGAGIPRLVDVIKEAENRIQEVQDAAGAPQEANTESVGHLYT